MKTYPAIALVARHGRRAAIAIGVLALVWGLASAWREGGLLPLAYAIVASVVAWGIARLLAELVEVIADTLLPR
ncbi:MAG: hypothetical protein ACKVQU_26460 [Burkholderiales bacterium]